MKTLGPQGWCSWLGWWVTTLAKVRTGETQIAPGDSMGKHGFNVVLYDLTGRVTLYYWDVEGF